MGARGQRLESVAQVLVARYAALRAEEVRVRERLVEARTRYRRALPDLARALRDHGEDARHRRTMLLALGRELAAAEEARSRVARALAQTARARTAIAGALAQAEQALEAQGSVRHRLLRDLVRLEEVLERRRAQVEALRLQLRRVTILLAVADRTGALQLASRSPPTPSSRAAGLSPHVLPRPLPLFAVRPDVGPWPLRLETATLASPATVHGVGGVLPPGVVLARFGQRVGALPSRGIAVAVDRPRAVRAPRPGRVVFAARLRGMGIVLILDHGGGYHGVFAGLGRVSVAPGATVTTGELLGMAVPLRGRPARVYMELRRMGRPVDPARGLAALAADRHSG